MEEYKKIIEKNISKDKKFQEALEIAKGNSLGGKIWIVGSFLYKNILKEKYNLQNLKIKDYDFILENQLDYSTPWAPEDWTIKKTFFGGPRFNKKGLEVDIYEIKDAIHKISTEEFLKKTPEEQIKIYLKNMLFDVQAITYEINEKKIIDGGSINAIENRVMKVTHLEDCMGISKRKGKTLKEYLDYKANKIGVKIVYPTSAEIKKYSKI